MEPKYRGYAQKEFYVGTNVIGRFGMNLSYWDNGILEVNVKGFSGDKKVVKDTLSVKTRAGMIDEVVDEVARGADVYGYLRVIEPDAKTDCGAKSAGACLDCCTHDYLPKCHAPETKTLGEGGISLDGHQLVEFERLFRNALREGIGELMTIA